METQNQKVKGNGMKKQEMIDKLGPIADFYKKNKNKYASVFDLSKKICHELDLKETLAVMEAFQCLFYLVEQNKDVEVIETLKKEREETHQRVSDIDDVAFA